MGNFADGLMEMSRRGIKAPRVNLTKKRAKILFKMLNLKLLNVDQPLNIKIFIPIKSSS